MLHKYKDVVIFDEDADSREYRKIVDMEWNLKKRKCFSMRGAGGLVPLASVECPRRPASR